MIDYHLIFSLVALSASLLVTVYIHLTDKTLKKLELIQRRNEKLIRKINKTK